MLNQNEKYGYLLKKLIPLIIFSIGCIPYQVLAESPMGISPLMQIPQAARWKLITPPTRSLFTAQNLETFLKELEGFPPPWKSLHDQPGEELGERLFRLNRNRDEIRDGHRLLSQRIAFFWGGILRQYDTDHQGFRVAIGPILTKTSWGTVRFKPWNLPNDMIAIPSKKILKGLQATIAQGKQIEIDILFTGFLLSHESLMYAFSHDEPHQGMILPFIQIDAVQYVLR